MSNPSKKKGNSFEYEIVKLFNTAYESTEFARTPGSGAFMGKGNWANKQGLAQGVKDTLSSDIIVPDWFKFSIECKSYKDKPNYSTLIKGPEKVLDDWIQQAEFDAKKLNLWPLLLFKTNNCGKFAVLRKDFLDVFRPEFFVLYRDSYLIIGIECFLENKDTIRDFASSKCCIHQT